MMKILHTSDWHLGQVFYNYDRSDEQAAFLSQLAGIAAARQPDAVVVSGDIFHTPSPSSAVQRMYVDAMLDLHRACPHATIVVTAGNHDSAAKLEIDSSLWRHFNLHVVGNIVMNDGTPDYGRHIIDVHDTHGMTVGRIIAVPHVYPQNFPRTCDTTDAVGRMRAFFARLQEEASARGSHGLPTVLMAHLAVAGSDTTGHDDSVGGLDTCRLDDIDMGCDYVALGHIHRPQYVPGSHGRARYSGSPLPVSFDEAYRHSVSLVRLGPGSDPAVETIAIDNPRPCVTLPSTPAPLDEALDRLAAFPDDTPAYIRLNVLADGYLPPDSNERAAAATAGKQCRLCLIHVTTPGHTADGEAHTMTVSEMKRMSPVDVAALYYKSTSGEELDEEMTALLTSAMKDVMENERQTD